MVEPEIEGTTRSATMEDLEAVVDLFNACSLELIGRPEYSADEIGEDWRSPGFCLESDTIAVFDPQGRLIGYGDLWGSSVSLVRFTSWVRVAPDHHGRGIGTYLNRWVEARARQDLAKAPPGARVVLVTHVFGRDGVSRELLAELGMHEVRYHWQMQIDLVEEPAAPQWPPGFQVRPVRPGEERAVYSARRAAFQDHWGYIEEPFEEGLARWLHDYTRADPYYEPSLWFFVEEAGQVAAFAVCSPRTIDDDGLGWISLLGVLRPWRRRGLGLALLQHCFGEFFRRGIPKAGLGVDAGSLTGATRLYEKAGMRVVEEYVTYEKELRAGRELRTQE
ncbi:MAG: GNAT family N-acetyltransferase, partial [Chloroflexia bacterium]|nr:GNAT family N-acetyltransferase [Chloroflexia bacterium]